MATASRRARQGRTTTVAKQRKRQPTASELAKAAEAFKADEIAERDLVFTNDEQPGIRRRGSKEKGFSYINPDGDVIRDSRTLSRIRGLVIPPAWTDVWISTNRAGHLQATGRDARGRKQYRYHPKYRESREQAKYEHVIDFAQALPKIRNRVREDLAKLGLPREKVIATVVRLLETTLIRVGNEEYAKQNHSYGLTTLRNRHVDVNGSKLRFEFKGKSGVKHNVELHDRRLATVIKRLEELPGQELFQYVDDNGERRSVSSADVNDYLREASGADFTAKDYRTWAGTVLAAVALQTVEDTGEPIDTKKQLKDAIESVARQLGNTPAICRKCYVHPDLIAEYLDGGLAEALAGRAEAAIRDPAEGLTPEEAAVLSLLKRRLRKRASGSS
jgi:DNA topoisomerase-1